MQQDEGVAPQLDERRLLWRQKRRGKQTCAMVCTDGTLTI